MAEWTPKQRVVLKADPDWKGTPVAFPEVHFINIEDLKAAELAFEAGEVDDHRRLARNSRPLPEADAGGRQAHRTSPARTTPGSA